MFLLKSGFNGTFKKVVNRIVTSVRGCWAVLRVYGEGNICTCLHRSEHPTQKSLWDKGRVFNYYFGEGGGGGGIFYTALL